MKIRISNQAVAEIVGAIILLAIAVAAFSVIYLNILSDPGPSEETYVTLIGGTESVFEEYQEPFTNVVFKHQRGEGISNDSIVMIKIAGRPLEEKPLIYVYELLDDFNKNGKWDIGEPLIYNSGQNLTGVQIEASVVDKTSNSLVFWGILQPGYIIPSHGRGGIWHFNESYWNGTPHEVKDSSGNNNHGAAYNGADTTIFNVSSVTINSVTKKTNTNRSGSFDGIDDYVEVADAYSLDITEQLTLEAWIKPSDIEKSHINLLEFKFGYTPFISHVKNNLFVVASIDINKNGGIIQTYNITPYGNISNSPLDESERFMNITGPGRDVNPTITQVSNDNYNSTFIIAYNDPDNDNYIHLKTFNISLELSSYGKIFYRAKELILKDTLIAGGFNRPSIIKISNEVFAIAYWASSDIGILKTIKIYSNNGTIEPFGNTLTFDDNYGHEPSIIYVGGNIYAIVYHGPSDNGIIKTFYIYSNNGTKEYTNQSYPFDYNKCWEPSIVHVDDNVFAIAYHGPSDLGVLKTFYIYSSNGSIQSTKNNKTLDVNCFYPCLIYQTNNYYILTYATNKAPGNSESLHYKIVEISNNGSILNIGPDVTYPVQNKFYTPISIKISNRIFAVVFEDHSHSGRLMTILAEYPSTIYSAGIYKYKSYGIYANSTKVFVNINTKTINTSIVADSWSHVVLTYNKDAPSNQMKLYINGTLMANGTLTDPIKITDSKLLFGDLFYGLIDEIAIFDRALTEDEIENHFANPGVFERNFTFYIDADGDRHGNPAVSVQASSAPVGYVSDNTDCDDTRSSVHPGAIEIHLNGIDDNCNGQIDELKDPVDSNTINVDSSSPIDKGTEINFAYCQDTIPDNDVMMLQETNQNTFNQVEYKNAGTGDGNTGTTINPGYPSNLVSGYLMLCQVMILGTTNTPSTPSGWYLLDGPRTTGNNDGRIWIYFKFSDGTETGTLSIYCSGGTGKFARIYSFSNVTSSDFNEFISWETSTGNSISDVSVTTTGTKELAINFVNIGEHRQNNFLDFTGEIGGNWIEVVSEFTNSAGDDGCLQLQIATMANAGIINGGSYSMGTYSDPAGVLGLALKPNSTIDYELDMEYQFDGASFTQEKEQVCLYLTGTVTESLLVDYWNINTWTNLGTINSVGWNNFTATGLTSPTYNIRIHDQNQTDEITQHSWTIDVLMLYTWDD